MKLAQLSGATVLRLNTAVKQKNSASSAETGPQAPAGESVIHAAAEVPVEKIGEALGSEDRGRIGVDTLWRSEAGDYYLQRERWNAGADASDQSRADYSSEIVRLAASAAREGSPSKNHTLTIVLPPAALLLLQAVAANEGRTVEDFALGALAETVRPIAEQWGDEESPALADFFIPEKEEA